jgi:Protein of unknown function (DUF998)
MPAIHQAARIAFGAAAAFLLLFALLHVLKPEMDPSRHMISEDALGRHRWIMRLAFISLAISCVALFFILWRERFVAGGVLLAIAGIGMLGVAVFATDPITTPRETITLVGWLHVLFATIFVIGFPVAATTMGWSAAGDRMFARLRLWLPWLSLMVWIGFIIFAGAVYAFAGPDPKFGPDVLIGWPQRIMVLTYAAWLIIVTWPVGMAARV